MLDVEKILTTLGIEYRGGGTDNFKIVCINPAHKEKKPSMYIHKYDGRIHCFGCNYIGSLFTLLRMSKGISGIEALLYLQRFSIGGQTEDEVRKALDASINMRSSERSIVQHAEVKLPEHRLLTQNFYLEKRGITRDEIEKWGMAVITEGRNIGWILIPLYQDGVLRNYFIRNTFGEGKLYGAYPRRDLLAGLDYAFDLSQPIYLIEGIFDSLAVGRTGVQSVACLSNRLLPEQLERLQLYKKIIIVPDTDARGIDLVESAGPLIHNCGVYVCKLPSHRKDAAECAEAELRQSLLEELPWNTYMIEKKIISKFN
jgi:DNA primase